MKNNLLKTVIILIAVTFVTLQSCEKKEIFDNSTELNKSENNNIEKQAELLTTEDINWILSNEDQEDMEVDKNLYYLGIALTDVLKEKSFIADIEKGAKSSQIDILSFDDLINQKGNAEKIINNKLSNTDFSAFTSDKDNLNYKTVSNNFHYKGFEYRPVIFIPNMKYADFSLSPIISPGIEVPDNPEKGIENAIIAWELNQDNKWNEKNIDEKIYLYSKRPVFVVSFNMQREIELDKSDVRILSSNDFRNNQDYGKGTWKQTCKEYKITERYERSGKSEYESFCFSLLYSGSKIDGYTGRIASISKNDIGKTFSANFTYCNTSSERRTVFNTYESDGYASPKYLGRITYSYQMFGRRKYYNEWYAFNPDTNNETNLWAFPTSGYKSRTSKGHIKFQASTIH